MKVNLNAMTQSQLFPYIINSLFDKINDGRDFLKVNRLFYDTSAEKGIEKLFFEGKESDQELEQFLVQNNFFSKNKSVVRLSKQFKESNTNESVFKNFCYLIEENTMDKNMPLLDNNNCFTHVGLNIKYDPATNQYFVMCILSQKVICIEDCLTLKDGNIIVGQILAANYYLYAAKIMKNEKIGYDIGPKNICFYINKLKFGMIFPKGDFRELNMRKVYLFLVNSDSCQVPYRNPSANAASVNWQQLELGLCQVVDFKKGKDFSKQTIAEFIDGGGVENYSQSMSAPVTNTLAPSIPPINIPKRSASSTMQNRLALISRLSQGKQPTIPPPNKSSFLVLTPSNKGNDPNSGLSGGGNNIRVNNTMMSTIQEESFNNLNQSFLNSTQKINVSPLCNGKLSNKIGDNNPISSGFSLGNNNSMTNATNVADVIGSKLQKAELLTGSINSASIGTSFGQTMNQQINSNNNMGMTGQNNNNLSFSNGYQSSQILGGSSNNPFAQQQQQQNQNFNLFNNTNNNTLNSNQGINSSQLNPQNNTNQQINTNPFSNVQTTFAQSQMSNNPFSSNNVLGRQNNLNNNPFSSTSPFSSNINQNQGYNSQVITQSALSQNNFQMNQNNQSMLNQNTNMNNNNLNQFMQNSILNNNPMNFQNNSFANPNINPQAPQNSTQPKVSLFSMLKPSTTVTTWQLIPNGLKYTSLIDVNGVGSHSVNQPPKLILCKNPKICINLSQFCSGNMQSYVVTPQTKGQFMVELRKVIEKNEITQEDRNNFLNSNLRILVEDNLGKLTPLNQLRGYSNIQKNIGTNSFANIKKELIFESTQPIKYKNMHKKLDDTNINTNKTSNNFNSNYFKFESSFKQNQRNQDSYLYSIEKYIFKDSLWNKTIQKSNQHSTSSFGDNIESYNDKILQNLIKKYLTPKEGSQVFNYNEAYVELYKTKNFSDIILTIKGEEILSHKIVLISQSPVFKEMIKQSEQKGPSLLNLAPEILKIVLPESYNIKTFKELLKWFYCGTIREGISIETLREMLMMAGDLKIYPLQKILIVKHIIPNMTKESALIFLKDTYKKVTPNETSEVWSLLANFSINCISKNSSILIKSNKTAFLSMDIDLLFKCIELSVYYLVEEIHLSLLIKLIIDKGYANDIFDLTIKLSEKFKMCRNFNIQNYNIDELLKSRPSTMPFDTVLINDETVALYNDIRNPLNTTLINNESIINNNNSITNSVFSFGESNKGEKKDQVNENIANNNIHLSNSEVQKFSSNSPKTNSMPDIDIKKHRAPTFEFTFQINSKSSTNSYSIFSECFNTSHRSWSLKIDLCSNGDVGFFLIERGPSTENPNYSMGYPLNFTSVLCDFSVRDVSFEKNSVFFFSFSNNQNQIIGYNSFFNIKQLGKKDTISFTVWMKEFPIHSACLQHLSDNFQPLFLNKRGKNDLKEIILNNNTRNDKSKNFLDLYPHDVASVIYNDGLRVDNENNVISALYMYCLNKEPSIIDSVIGAVRFEFVDFKIMCTLARDHDSIRHCPMFRFAFGRELNERMQKLSGLTENKELKVNENNCVISQKIGTPRRFYALAEDPKKLNISNELISFFLDKNHHDGYIDKLKKLQGYLEQEKKEHIKREEILERQNRELKLEMQRMAEVEVKRKKLMNQNNYNNTDMGSIAGVVSSVCNFFKPK